MHPVSPSLPTAPHLVLKSASLVKLGWWFAGIAVAAHVAYYSVIAFPQNRPAFLWMRFFDLDHENSFACFLSILLLLFSALLLDDIYRRKRASGDPLAVYWRILSWGFVYLSIDESAQIHESIGTQFDLVFGTQHGMWMFSWTIPAIAAIVLVGVAFLRFLFRLPARTRAWFLISGFTYIGSAVGLELAGGAEISVHGNSYIYSIFATFEETGEMLGVLLFLNELVRVQADLSSAPIETAAANA